jgi:hypothetical protein
MTALKYRNIYMAAAHEAVRHIVGKQEPACGNESVSSLGIITLQHAYIMGLWDLLSDFWSSGGWWCI